LKNSWRVELLLYFIVIIKKRGKVVEDQMGESWGIKNEG
jgi:hypothetical protein